jgi:hypothetical protein
MSRQLDDGAQHRLCEQGRPHGEERTGRRGYGTAGSAAW